MNLIKEAVLLEEQKEYKKIYDGQGGEKFYKMTFETFYDGMIISKKLSKARNSFIPREKIST